MSADDVTTNLQLVLAAEDEETDAFILRQAFQRAKLPNRLVVVSDGEGVINYLAGRPPFDDRDNHPLPLLLLLDIKMPRMSGFDVLAWLGTRPEFRELPAVVLSSSSDETDIRKARDLGARDYFVKPLSLPELVEIVQTLSSRWMRV